MRGRLAILKYLNLLASPAIPLIDMEKINEAGSLAFWVASVRHLVSFSPPFSPFSCFQADPPFFCVCSLSLLRDSLCQIVLDRKRELWAEALKVTEKSSRQPSVSVNRARAMRHRMGLRPPILPFFADLPGVRCRSSSFCCLAVA